MYRGYEGHVGWGSGMESGNYLALRERVKGASTRLAQKHSYEVTLKLLTCAV